MNKKIILAIAIVLPLIPLIELASQLGADLAGDHFPPILAIYYPARVFALVGFTLMFYQFVIGAKLPVVEKIIDKRGKLLKTHRTLGKWGGILMLLHGLLLLMFDVAETGGLVWEPGRLLGITGLFLIIAAVVAAWWFKPLQFSYNTWKRIHLLAYAVFPIIFLHAFMLGSTVQQSVPTHILFSAMFVIYLGIVGYKLFGPNQKQSAKKKKPAAEAATKDTAGESG